MIICDACGDTVSSEKSATVFGEQYDEKCLKILGEAWKAKAEGIKFIAQAKNRKLVVETATPKPTSEDLGTVEVTSPA